MVKVERQKLTILTNFPPPTHDYGPLHPRREPHRDEYRLLLLASLSNHAVLFEVAKNIISL